MTFAADSNRFYATLGTGGSTYLVEFDLAARRGRTVVDNLECPSLSPDGTRIAFKKRVSDTPVTWRFSVLDLATLEQRPLAETRNVDDQIEWLDDSTVLYGVSDPSRVAVTDVWRAAADGSGTPQLFAEEMSSPAVVAP